MFDKIGGLDERLFLFYTDSDYCYTARNNGYEVWYEPESKVAHRLGSSTTAKDQIERDKTVFESKWINPSSNWTKLNMLP